MNRRVGGFNGSADTSLEVDSGDVILDNIWAWRADHGNPGTVGWTTNAANTGVVVNGTAVTATGLAVEHYQKDQVIWNGEGGETVFYQSELPYDVPNQAAWQSGGSTISPAGENENGTAANGYPSYYVGPGVCNHLAYGMGIYSFFNQGVSIVDDNAIQVPPNSNSVLTNLTTVFLNGSGQISNVVNGQGPVANSSDVSTPQPLPSFTGTGNCTTFSETAGSTVEPGLVGFSNPNPNGWNPGSIVNAIASNNPDLTVVMAHRGSHALITGANSGVPENSLQAIGLAAQQGIEAVEVDIKLTSDNVPILSHDYNWGREWCGLSSFSPITPPYSFNPFVAPGNSSNDAVNPAVNSVSLSNTRSFLGDTVLRDNISVANPFINRGCTGYNNWTGEYPPTLQDVLDYMTRNKIPTVLVLDIKDATTAGLAWNVVLNSAPDYQGVPYARRVLFKIPARNFQDPNSIASTFPASNSLQALLFPYIGTADIQPTSSGFGSEQAINNWIVAVENNPNDELVAMEVNLKQSAGILSSTVLTAKAALTVGDFSPYTEYQDSSNPGVSEYFSNKGYCAPCDQLSTYFTTAIRITSHRTRRTSAETFPSPTRRASRSSPPITLWMPSTI